MDAITGTVYFIGAVVIIVLLTACVVWSALESLESKFTQHDYYIRYLDEARQKQQDRIDTLLLEALKEKKESTRRKNKEE